MFSFKVTIQAAFLATLALPTLSWAKSTGYYTATVRPTNRGGDWNNLGMALSGWSCHGSDKVIFTELMPDHKGRVKEVTQNSSSRFNFSVFSMGQAMSTNFVRNMDLPSPTLVMTVTESCTKRETYSTMERDHEGRYRSVTKTRTKEAWMRWSCDTSRLPQRQGEWINTVCSPSESYFGDFGLEGVLVSIFRKKTFDLNITLISVQDTYIKDLCGSDLSNRMVLKIQQGVGGHVGENDFIVHVKVNGTGVDIPTAHGLINDEIAICPRPGEDIHVEVSATEDDLFFDDHYIAEKSLTFRQGPENFQNQSIKLKRKTYWGELFTDRSSEITVRLSRASR